MISNQQHSSFGHQSYHQPYAAHAPRASAQEDTLKTEQIRIERKTIHLSLKENPRGRFLRISEEVGDRRSSIIIPATGLTEFKKLIAEMAKVSDSIPAKSEPVAS